MDSALELLVAGDGRGGVVVRRTQKAVIFVSFLFLGQTTVVVKRDLKLDRQ
jgi:hypothetical protein